MDYLGIYINLITAASLRERLPASYPFKAPMERHHIIPRSLGGLDDPDNIVSLTVREHFFAHELLLRAGFTNQIFAIAAFLQDGKRPSRKKLKWKKWLRKTYAHELAKAARLKRRERLGYSKHK